MLRCLLLLLVVGVSGLTPRPAAAVKSPLHVGVGIGVGVAACEGVAVAGVGVAGERLQDGPAVATSGKYGTGSSDGEFVFSWCSCGLMFMFFSLFSSGATFSWASWPNVTFVSPPATAMQDIMYRYWSRGMNQCSEAGPGSFWTSLNRMRYRIICKDPDPAQDPSFNLPKY